MTSIITKPHDPSGVLLRRGIICGTVGPALFAVGLSLVDDDTFALFASFAAFAACGLVWFGGPARKRVVPYLAFMVTGAALVVLGTALSNSVVAGMVAMLVIGFAVRFLGVFGGYAAAGGNAVLLAFVLPVMVGASPDQYLARLSGWLVGCAVAIAAVLVLIPDRSREQLRSRAAGICRDIGRVAEWDEAAAGPAEQRRALTDQVVHDVRALREGWASQPFRPAGPGLTDQSYLTIVEALNRIVPYLRRDLELEQDAEVVAIAAPLRRAVVNTLRGAAELLEGRDGDPHLLDLDRARVDYRATLGEWVDGRHVRVGPADTPASRVAGHPLAEADGAGMASVSTAALVVDRVEEGFALLVASHDALTIGANAALMEHREVLRDPQDLDPDMPEGGRSVLGTAQRARRTLQSHLHFSDLTFRVAVRTGVVMALAVYLADLLGFGHKFWVVLGAMTVLRTSAVGTSTSSVQAVLGTVIGFVLSGLLVQTTSTSPSWLWVALIASMFLAAYAPNAISFTVGQASFTLFVVVLFTILQPAGWATGIQRVEAMGTGIAVAVVGGFALWPRGAKAVVGQTVAHFLRAAGHYLDTAAYSFVHPGEASIEGPRRGAADARWAADDAFNGLVGEQRTEPEVLVAWVRLLCVPASTRSIADAIRSLPDRGYPCCHCTDAVDAVVAELDRVEAILDRVGSRLLHPADAVPVAWGSPIGRTRDAVIGCLADQLERPVDRRESVLGLLFVLESLSMLDDVLSHMAEPLDLVSADLLTSAWR